MLPLLIYILIAAISKFAVIIRFFQKSDCAISLAHSIFELSEIYAQSKVF